MDCPQNQQTVSSIHTLFRSTGTSVPGASNKLGEWVSDWVHRFSPWASSAMKAAKETKFGTKVACASDLGDAVTFISCMELLLKCQWCCKTRAVWLFAGTIYCDARSVHEERTGLSSSLLHHGTVDLQRPSRSTRSDPSCQRRWWCMSCTVYCHKQHRVHWLAISCVSPP